MSDKIYKTKGIVLKSVRYGETSIIVSAYTQLFGLQSYLLNGIRTTSKKGTNKIGFFQPASILEMEVYHNELKQLNRVKEYKWAFLYQNIFTDVLKNGVASYMIELLFKCLKQPERNDGLFAFVEDCLEALDTCSDTIMANFPIFYATHLTHFFGFSPEHIKDGSDTNKNIFFDIELGAFTREVVFHNSYLENKAASLLAELLLVRQPQELSHISANADERGKILDAMETYYNIHIPEFGKMKTLPVLKTIMR